MKKVLVILGQTATGKTDLALNLAKKYNGELVSADSRQVYEGLDIGTGKLPGKDVNVKKYKGLWEMDGKKVWMYDVANPRKQYTVKDYVDQAEKVIEDILKRGKLPIIVGGTGLYLKALLEGLSNLAVPVNKKLRGELEKLSLEDLQKKLISLSPTAFAKLNNSDRQNPRRLLRSIELILMNPYRSTSGKRKVICDKYKVLKIGLTAPRAVLKEKIFRRLISRIDLGLVEEAERLVGEGISLLRLRQLGLEYGVLVDLLEGKITQEEMVKILTTKIGQFAKRQETWFKKEKGVNWFDVSQQRWSDQVEKKVGLWYHAGDDDKTD